MKKHYLLYLIFVFKMYGQTNIGGVISSNTTFPLANSPYTVTNNLLIQQNVVVSVDSGVVFKFNNTVYLQVDGTLRALGGSSNPIIFTASTGFLKWSGIRFTNLSVNYDSISNTGCILDHCVIELANDFGNNERAIKAVNSSPRISNCIIRNNNCLALLHIGSSKIFNNKFYGNEFSVDLKSANGSIWPSFCNNEVYNQTVSNTNADITIGRVNFLNNYIHDEPQDIAVRVSDTVIFCGNIFENNQVALALLGGDNHKIINNTFVNNKTNLVVTCARQPLIKNNNFMNFLNYNIYCSNDYSPFMNYSCNLPSGSGTYLSLDVSGNFFNSINSSALDNSIWDFNDDFSLKELVTHSSTLSDTVNITNEGCSLTTGNIEYFNEKQNTNIYPNPASNQFFFDANTTDILIVDLFDVNGKHVYSQNISNKSIINIASLDNGIYTMIIKSDGHVTNKKLVIAR